MLGERDRASSSNSATSDATCFQRVSSMGPPAPAPLFSSPQRVSQSQQLVTLDAGSFPLFGLKSELRDSLDTASGMDEMATRQASLVGSQEEPEHEQELPINAEHNPTPTEAKKAEVHVIKRRNVGVPKFLRFLYQILDAEDPNIITWSHEGTAFQIIQPDELAIQILPRYFKHNKVSSFQRQLNYFGFKKWTKTQTNICTFSHPFFLRADKDRMKFIKRKERANPALMSAMAATITSNPVNLMNQLQAQEHARAHHFEAQDLMDARSQLPTQQALKRQKSNNLSGATVTFLNSAAAGRRHSTGMLPGSEAFGMAAAAAAAVAAAEAAGSLPGRKRAGTPAEQEFELEMEARTEATATSSSAQQQFMYLQKIAEAKQRYPYQAGRGKRQNPPPGFGDSFGLATAMNMPGSGVNGGFGPRNTINLGRRRSDQVLTDYSSGKSISISQIEEFVASSGSSSSPQPIFASNMKSDASAVLPVTSNSFNQDTSYQLPQQRQQMPRQMINRSQNIYAGSGYGSPSIKTETSSGWPTCVNANSTSAQSHSMMMPFKFGDSTFQQRPPMTHPQHLQRYHQQQRQEQQERKESTQQPRDYIDVLLESAGLDETLPSQTSTTLPSESWHYPPSQNGQSNSGSTGSYSFMAQQQQGQHLQLSPTGELPHNPNLRF
ncbi:HSF-type DNA-binding [Phytophthora infestans]|nr:HSF-type DNA-binding [Phytophthora infestans]